MRGGATLGIAGCDAYSPPQEQVIKRQLRSTSKDPPAIVLKEPVLVTSSPRTQVDPGPRIIKSVIESSSSSSSRFLNSKGSLLYLHVRVFRHQVHPSADPSTVPAQSSIFMFGRARTRTTYNDNESPSNLPYNSFPNTWTTRWRDPSRAHYDAGVEPGGPYRRLRQRQDGAKTPQYFLSLRGSFRRSPVVWRCPSGLRGKLSNVS